MASILLFEQYPTLKVKIPHVSLGDFPTPVFYCSVLSQKLGCEIYAKRDDKAGHVRPDGSRLFGGNKIRKLEFELAKAHKSGSETIVTSGCAGSNHALATTLYAQTLNLKTRCLLSDQPNSWVVQRNLLLLAKYGAQISYYKTIKERKEAVSEQIRLCQESTGLAPYILPPGASTPLGVVGFINAIFELAEQIKAGQMKQPHVIYLPAGSLGTAVGLLIGLQLIAAPTAVVAVAVEPFDEMRQSMKKLFELTKNFLCDIDESFSSLVWQDDRLIVRDQYYGEGYGFSTQEATQAEELFACEGITLENTYTAKAVAALVADATGGFLKGKTVLYWVTFYGEPCLEIINKVSYRELPEEFHKYWDLSDYNAESSTR